MASIASARRTDAEVTTGQHAVSLPLMGAVRTDRPLTEGQDGDWILPLVKRAQERVMSQKAALLTMGLPKTQYIENLQGTGHLSIRKLGMLPKDFWEALIDELRAYYGLDNDAERFERAVECVNRGMQQIAEIARKGMSR